jgi:hypothetical protein
VIVPTGGTVDADAWLIRVFCGDSTRKLELVTIGPTTVGGALILKSVSLAVIRKKYAVLALRPDTTSVVEENGEPTTAVHGPDEARASSRA